MKNGKNLGSAISNNADLFSAMPIDYWLLGAQYLQLAEASCNELVASKNAHFVTEAGRLPSATDYKEKTKWSDHTVGIAVLFNYFHGIEVILKGFIVLAGDAVPRHHKLTALLSDFEAKFPESTVANLIRSSTIEQDVDTPLGRFFQINEISVDAWYEALKYPESNKGQLFSHNALKFGGENVIPFWEIIAQSSQQICIEAVKLARSLEHADNL